MATHSDQIAAALLTALAREFARQDDPKPGDRPVSAVMVPLAMKTLHAVAATLPGKDGEQLLEAYSYRPNAAPLTAIEMCQRGWIVSHAIEDSALAESGAQASLMRKTVTATAYGSAFRRLYGNAK